MEQWYRQTPVAKGGGTLYPYTIVTFFCGFIRNGLGFARWPNSGSENIALIMTGGREPKAVYVNGVSTFKYTQKFKIFFLCFFSDRANNIVITCLSSSVVLLILISENLSVLSSETVIS